MLNLWYQDALLFWYCFFNLFTDNIKANFFQIQGRIHEKPMQIQSRNRSFPHQIQSNMHIFIR